MERALLEQQARANKATAALQAVQQQQQQSAVSAQQGQRHAAAAQTAGIGASAVVGTRLLGKPVAFDGRETSWRSFKFQIGQCGAIDSRLKDLPLGEFRDAAAMHHNHMDQNTRAHSAQLYYMLILLCRNCFTTNSPVIREQRWTSSMYCFAGAARSQEGRAAKA